jgi:hypothetical protein
MAYPWPQTVEAVVISSPAHAINTPALPMVLGTIQFIFFIPPWNLVGVVLGRQPIGTSVVESADPN